MNVQITLANGQSVKLGFTLPNMFLALKKHRLQFDELNDPANSMLFVLEYIELALPKNFQNKSDFLESLAPEEAKKVMAAAQKSIEDKSNFFSKIALASQAETAQEKA